MYIAERARRRYQPATCVASSITGSTVTPSVTLNFNDCSGPRGLRQLTGQLIEVVGVDTAGHYKLHLVSGA